MQELPNGEQFFRQRYGLLKRDSTARMGPESKGKTASRTRMVFGAECLGKKT
jgi:hypothetical protein